MDFKWELDLSEEEKKTIGKHGQITKNGKVEITQDEKKFDWWWDVARLGPSTLSILSNSRDATLEFAIRYDVTQGSVGRGLTRGESLTCKDEKITKVPKMGEKIYGESARKGGQGLYNRADVSQNLNVNISFDLCSFKEKEQIECSLKVVTEIN